jgi:hypothetical protein
MGTTEEVRKVLDPYYAFATTADLEAALKSIRFELEQRQRRGDA